MNEAVIYASRDEAIGVAAHEAASEGGGVVVVHESTCTGDSSGRGCSCSPTTHIVVGIAKE